MSKQNTVIISDTSIDYTDAERDTLKYTYDEVIKAAKYIKADRGMGAMKLESQHRAAHAVLLAANGNRKLSLPEYNHALSTVVSMEIGANKADPLKRMYGG